MPFYCLLFLDITASSLRPLFLYVFSSGGVAAFGVRGPGIPNHGDGNTLPFSTGFAVEGVGGLRRGVRGFLR